MGVNPLQTYASLRSHWSRRDFLLTTGAAAGAALLWRPSTSSATPRAEDEAPEAAFYESRPDGSVRCRLCPWGCELKPGQRGHCRVRENRKGRLVSLVYARPCAMNNDPIEKKPFYHVLPGTLSFSIATVGCNLRCRFCQNWDIAQEMDPSEVRGPAVKPETIAEMAAQRGARSVAYTYSEPVVFTEYVLDCARAARDRGLANVVVSNGFIEAEPLKEWCRVLTAVKVDLKAFTEHFYERICEGRLQPVLDTLKRLSESGIWYEIVVLLIPTLNDSADELRRLAGWVAKELGPNVPLHFSRFHPDYKLRNLPPTPPRTVEQARVLARQEGCRFVYTGNLPGMEGENTDCPQCGTRLIARHHFTVLSNVLKEGHCPKCGEKIPGVWT